jgi:hypothetical protein
MNDYLSRFEAMVAATRAVLLTAGIMEKTV